MKFTKKKVLIITYYWPPAGGAGVQRWLKFAKYLPEFAIEPIIYTPKNPSYPILDESLANEVSDEISIIRTKIFEPYSLAKIIQKNQTKAYQKGQFESDDNQKLFSKLMIWIRGNLFIPDARKFWIQPSVKFLSDYLEKHQVNTIISTGPPHSLHLIGLKLKAQNKDLQWIADFRDPWTQISYHKKLKLSKYAKNRHVELEKQVFKNADSVLSTSYSDAKNFKNAGAKKVEIITNGFDFDRNQYQKQKSDKFRLVYSGGLEAERNPESLWKSLKNLKVSIDSFGFDLELIFFGSLSNDVKQRIEFFGLNSNLIEKGYVSHRQSIQGIINADLLWLTSFNEQVSKGIIPGKLFEYLGTQNTILSIGPKESDVKKILKETKAGEHFNHTNLKGIEDFIKNQYLLWKQEDVISQTEEIKRFSRRELTKKLATLLK